LGIEESWLFALRQRTLQRWLEALEPEPAGRRPAAAPAPEHEPIAALQGRIRQLELELEAARLRAELEQARRPPPTSEASRAAKKARP
jgi:hypothetical protein